MPYVYCLAGLLLLGWTLGDFVFTVLSNNGSGKMTKGVNGFLARIFVPRSPRTRAWTGVLHLLATLTNWIVCFLLAGILLYGSFPEMVVDATTGTPAAWTERLYFTGFVFSTLGVGDFVPGTDGSRYFTVFYSVLGFAVLTTAITYILSVMSAATNKANVAAFISSMGNTPPDLYDYFTSQDAAGLLTSATEDLVQLLDLHANNHLAYPIVHYYLAFERRNSAVIQLASLHEVLVALRADFTGQTAVQAQIERIDRVLHRYLKMVRTQQQFSDDGEGATTLRSRWRSGNDTSFPRTDAEKWATGKFGTLLRQFGWEWSDVYREKENA